MDGIGKKPCPKVVLGIRTALRVNSHFAFSPSSPQIIKPAESGVQIAEAEAAGVGEVVIPLVRAARLHISEGTIPIVIHENVVPWR